MGCVYSIYYCLHSNLLDRNDTWLIQDVQFEWFNINFRPGCICCCVILDIEMQSDEHKREFSLLKSFLSEWNQILANSPLNCPYYSQYCALSLNIFLSGKLWQEANWASFKLSCWCQSLWRVWIDHWKELWRISTASSYKATGQRFILTTINDLAKVT